MRPNGPPPRPQLDNNPTGKTIALFEALVRKGRERHAQLTAAQGGITGVDRAARQGAFAAHYATAAASAVYDDVLAVETKPAGFPDAVTYVNAPDPLNGEIRAYHNAGRTKDDPNPAWFLSSSDVLFFQYAAAAGGNLPAHPLRRVQRTNVASGSGTHVMTCGKALFGPGLFGVPLTPGDPEAPRTADFGPDRVLTASKADLFFAWLGTENATSSTWLIRDHGQELGIGTITHIVANSEQNITIHLA